MKNTHIAPASIESMLEELGENENIIVLTDERKLYVPIGWSSDTFETTCANFIMITGVAGGRAINISAQEAFKLIETDYIRTVE